MYNKVFTVYIYYFTLLINNINLNIIMQFMSAAGVLSSTQYIIQDDYMMITLLFVFTSRRHYSLALVYYTSSVSRRHASQTFELLITLRASCGAVYCNRSYLRVYDCCGSFYHDNSKLRAPMLT